jgi:hypothetical protein
MVLSPQRKWFISVACTIAAFVTAGPACASGAVTPSMTAPLQAQVRSPGSARPPEDVDAVARWLLQKGSNENKPFLIADKRRGFLYVFQPNGQLIVKAKALYGAARSDFITTEQANKAIGELSTTDMITPAGMFKINPYNSPAYGPALRFAMYERTNLLIHRAPIQWRRNYLASAATNRSWVTYGCINVLPGLLDDVILPALKHGGVLVVLPETTPAGQFFGIEDSVGS